MGIRERFFTRGSSWEDEGSSRGASLTASAKPIDLNSEKDKAAHRKRFQKWQKEAWEYYDKIGEIWFAMNFGGNAMKKMILVPAMIGDPDQPPVPIKSGEKWFDEMNDLIIRMRGNDGTIGEFLKDMYINLNVPGEGMLVIRNMDEEDETWHFYNSEQLFVNSNGNWAIRQSELDNVGDELNSRPGVGGGGDYVCRVHRSHPRWKDQADSAMKAVLIHCDELLILSKQIRATGRSRLPAGIFLAPKEAHPSKPKQPGRGTVGGTNAAEENPFVDDFIKSLVTPVEDESSVASIAPTIFLVPAQYLKDKLYQFLDFKRDIDKEAGAQRLELIQRIANGIDMPADVLLGKSNMNHWSAWQVDEDTFKSHLEPATMLMVSALTAAIIRAFIPEAPMELVFWFDPKLVVNHPNKSEDADKAFDRMSISWAAHRKAKGFQEEDAPTDDEIERRIEIDRAKRVRSNETANGEGDRKKDAEDPIPKQSESEAEGGATVRPLRMAE